MIDILNFICKIKGLRVVKKIVVVSYATYPSVGPRQFRTNELVKELARKGHDVTLYVLIGGYDYEGYQKENNLKVVSLGCPVLFNFNHDVGTTLNFYMKVLNKFIGRFVELPYMELVFNTYKAIGKESKIDLLITIGAPYPLHWGAALFRSRNKDKLRNTTWIADCGDPYMGNPFIKKPFYFKYIEKWFCKKADFISIPIEGAREAYYPEFNDKIKIIPQGFNFNEIKIIKNNKNVIPVFIYAGTFYKNLRDPRPFLDYLVTLNKDFKFIVYTKNILFLKEYREVLGNKLEVYNYIPREKLILEMSKADFLVNLENPSEKQSPSKLIDYALSEKPILSINTNKKIDVVLIDQFLSGYYENSFRVENIEQYNIKNVANDFLRLIKAC